MSSPRPAWLLDLPLTAYRRVHDLQHHCAAARRSKCLKRDLIIVTEHPPVFTLGRRGGRENLLVSEEALKDKGINVIPVERGGDITYHGPGQIIAYPIFDLGAAKYRVVELVETLEEAMVRTAADWGISARGDKEQRGAWVGSRKLGSVGITIRRSISFHGLALNVNTDLSPFSWIHPCGIPDCAMTSLSLETGREVSMTEVRRQLTGHLARLLNLALDPINRTAVEKMAAGSVRSSLPASSA
jgi:lipoate-protein ligase B